VDGGSKDRTLSIVRELLEEKVAYSILKDEGKGLGYARDIGWRDSDEDYVTMIDSDVIVNPAFFKEGIALMERDPSLGGVSAKLKPITKEKGWLARFQVKCYATHLHLHEPVYPSTVRSLHTGCTLFRRSALEKINGFDPQFKVCEEDSDVSFRLRKAGYKLCYLGLTSAHLETGKRFFKINFRYGNSVKLCKKHFLPLWPTKRKVFAAVLFAPLLQWLIYCIYVYKYGKLRLTLSEKLVLPLIETVRQAVRTAGFMYYLIAN
jgi:GT2 family glycosyltransferase